MGQTTPLGQILAIGGETGTGLADAIQTQEAGQDQDQAAEDAALLKTEMVEALPIATVAAARAQTILRSLVHDDPHTLLGALSLRPPLVEKRN